MSIRNNSRAHVTWLLPVKNGMPYLPETLASIEAQTYSGFELLAWDNGSDDGTLEELRNWIPSRLPGTVVCDHPMGLGASLAELVKMADTEFCARIDADDINFSQRLEKQLNFLNTHPDIALVGSPMETINADGVVIGEVDPLFQHHNAIVHTMLSTNAIMHPTVMFRRAAVLAAGNYRQTEPANVEDYDLWLRMAVQHKLSNLAEPMLRYRVHDRSTTQLSMRNNVLNDTMQRSFSLHAPALYGCTEHEAQTLRRGRYPLAIRLLYRIARHLSVHQGGSCREHLCSSSFLKASRRLVRRRDVLSRLILASLEKCSINPG